MAQRFVALAGWPCDLWLGIGDQLVGWCRVAVREMASYNSVEWKEHVSDYDRVFHRPAASRIEATDEGEPDDGPPVRPPLLSLEEWLSKPKARRKRPYAQNSAFELQQLNQGEPRGPNRRDADPTATTAS